MTTRRVPRWRVALAGTLTLVSVGLLAAEPFLLAATAIPLSYVLYGAVARVPSAVDLRAHRRVETSDPTPGDPVWVTLAVENAGESTLGDVRVVDGVPDELVVVEGSPRGCLSLRPGEAAELRYAVLATRGTHGFDAPAARVRPLAATEVASDTLPVTGVRTLTAANAVSEAPPSDATLPRAGTLPTDSGGSGVEFHAMREYRPGDPVSRIDWRRFAKTGALTTVEYRKEQAVKNVLVVDARPAARVTSAPGYPTGAELGAYAAERLLDALSGAGAAASVAAVGLQDDDLAGGLDPDGLAWIDAKGGAGARAATLFDGVVAAAARGPDPPPDAPDSGESDGDRSDGPGRQAEPADEDSGPGADGDRGDGPGADGDRVAAETGPGHAPDGGSIRPVTALLERLPPAAQVIVFSPLVDDWPVDLVRNLAARGYSTTVVSPDVARGDAVGGRLVATERSLRLGTVERTGATCIDWHPTEPIDLALRASLADLHA